MHFFQRVNRRMKIRKLQRLYRIENKKGVLRQVSNAFFYSNPKMKIPDHKSAAITSIELLS